MSPAVSGIYAQARFRRMSGPVTTAGGKDIAGPRLLNGSAIPEASGLAGNLARSSRLTGSCATERSRSVTIGNNHAALVSAATYTDRSGPGGA